MMCNQQLPSYSWLSGCVMRAPKSQTVQPKPIPLRLHAGELAVLAAATEPLTIRPTVDFPLAINAACLHADRAGWLAEHAGHVVGERERAACSMPWRHITTAS